MSGVKFSDKVYRIQKRTCVFLAGLLMFSLTACGSVSYDMPYNADGNVSGYNVLGKSNSLTVPAFAQELCIVNEDRTSEDVDMSAATSALLCDVSNAEVLYAKNPHERLYPASLTKVMTALVALKYGSMDQTLTSSSNAYVTESGAQLCGLKAGDSMTLNQALHILLLQSANDVGMLIAENLGGTVEKFVEMMNAEARALGATNTNFMNPHGLSDDNHYTTAYDMYLIFNEAVKFEKFVEIIQMSGYETTYYDKDSDPVSFSCKTTNWYLRGEASAPENVTVIGGKTGATKAAGQCLLILSRDKNGAPFISVVLRSDSREQIYTQMSELLNKINK